MAYMSKEHKGRISVALKAALKNTNVKVSLAVRNHSTIVCTIKSAPVDLVANWYLTTRNLPNNSPIVDRPGYVDVNPYHYRDHFTGQALEIVTKIMNCLNLDNYDNSRIEYDYFDVGHYVTLNIGRYNKHFVVK